MRHGLKWVLMTVILAGVLNPAAAGDGGERPLIQMAILLDTSGSMEGLIEQAKTRLWKIVNQFALAKKRGRIPRLQVALYEYGKSSIPASEGYIRMIVPLSEDLDRISEELFRLQTNGGSEYCGQVIQSAARALRWQEDSGIYRVMFIAGNEPFTQGPIRYQDACADAISAGIMVNTIFCGDHQEGIRTFWKHGADLADGRYMSINHNRKVVHIDAPQDDEIVRLGRELNKTYIGYGAEGEAKKARQSAQDKNAMEVHEEVMVERSVAKASPQYSNSGWDLVDAIEKGHVQLDELKEDELPAEMRSLTPRERAEYVARLKKQRTDLQNKIKQLNRERRRYVAEKRKELSQEDTLDAAMITAIREQAREAGFTFESNTRRD